jgi:hypothetical protein
MFTQHVDVHTVSCCRVLSVLPSIAGVQLRVSLLTAVSKLHVQA